VLYKPEQKMVFLYYASVGSRNSDIVCYGTVHGSFEGPGTLPCKLHIFRKRVRKVKISEEK